MELDLLIFALSGVKSDRRDERMRCRDERVEGYAERRREKEVGGGEVAFPWCIKPELDLVL